MRLRQLEHFLHFQSTPPRRRRLKVMYRQSERLFFNPRLREGGDISSIYNKGEMHFFNPRLREGGDLFAICINSISTVFNPRLREGGDEQLLRQPLWGISVFNPRLREGGDVS